jgi:hypothetical protein
VNESLFVEFVGQNDALISTQFVVITSHVSRNLCIDFEWITAFAVGIQHLYDLHEFETIFESELQPQLT